MAEVMDFVIKRSPPTNSARYYQDSRARQKMTADVIECSRVSPRSSRRPIPPSSSITIRPSSPFKKLSRGTKIKTRPVTCCWMVFSWITSPRIFFLVLDQRPGIFFLVQLSWIRDRAETLGFTSIPPPYLSPQASGKNLLIGANFASAASGYYDETAILYKAIPLSQQLEYYKEYQSKLKSVAGSGKATSILSGALYIIGAGSSDFIQNYYVNPYLNKIYSPDEYSSFLVSIFSNFVKDLYGLGARRIGVTSLPPLGCLPLSINLFGYGKSGCVANFNADAKNFNKKITAAINSLTKKFPNLKIAALDIYTPLLELTTNPSKNGFFEAGRGCCGTGTVETTSFLCNPKSIGTCSNATGYVFWDSVHPSQAANQFIADSLILAGISLVS